MLVMLVSNGYKINSMKVFSDHAIAEVEFMELGELVNGHWFYPFEFNLAKSKRTKEITMGKFEGRWVVTTNFLSPNISSTTALKYINQFANYNIDDKRAAKFAKVLRKEISDAAK